MFKTEWRRKNSLKQKLTKWQCVRALLDIFPLYLCTFFILQFIIFVFAFNIKHITYTGNSEYLKSFVHILIWPKFVFNTILKIHEKVITWLWFFEMEFCFLFMAVFS